VKEEKQYTFDEAVEIWTRKDPKCPGCGKVHARIRVGNSLTWIVKGACPASAKGLRVPIELFLQGSGHKEED
jgi:hypothetical protein